MVLRSDKRVLAAHQGAGEGRPAGDFPMTETMVSRPMYGDWQRPPGRRCLPCSSVRGWHPLDGHHGDIVGEVPPDME